LSSREAELSGVSKPSDMVSARTLGLDTPFGLLDHRVLTAAAVECRGTKWSGVSRPSKMASARTLGLDTPFGLLDRRVLSAAVVE
jgi:hypothetical protein